MQGRYLCSLYLRFTVKLFPPFAYVVQFGVEVYKDFNLLAVLVEFIAGGCIDSCRVFSERNILSASFSMAAAPATSFSMSKPATAMGSRPTGVSTEKRAPIRYRDNERFVNLHCLR